MTSLRVRVTVLPVALVLTAVSAAADPGEESNDAEDVVAIPRDCKALVPRTAESPLYWDRWLSLAACMQDASIGNVSQTAQLDPLLQDQIVAVAPSMMLYSEALERAPRTVQFRAAYHVGLASVALLTRARRSIQVTGQQALAREAELRAELEWRLEPVKAMARTALGAVLDGAQLDPSVAADPVGRNMVRSAAILLAALGEARAEQQMALAID